MYRPGHSGTRVLDAIANLRLMDQGWAATSILLSTQSVVTSIIGGHAHPEYLDAELTSAAGY